MRRYLDASVIVPLIIAEATSAKVQARFASASDTLIVSDLAAAEVSSAISRLVRARETTPERGITLLGRFDVWRLAGTVPLSLQPDDLPLATALVRRFELKLRTPDALHLVIARRRNATLTSFDRRLLLAAEAIGQPTLLIA